MAISMPMLCVVSAVLVLLAGLPQCSAVDHAVEWSKTPTPTSLNVKCADTITLTWKGFHDVAKAATGDCPADAKLLSGAAKTGGKYVYTLGQRTTGSFWLICTVPGHCTDGQNIKVTVTCPTTSKAANSTSSPSAASPAATTKSPAGNTTASAKSPSPSPKASPTPSSALPSAQLAFGWTVVALVAVMLSL